MTSPRVRSADRRADRAQDVCYFEVTSPSWAESGTHQSDPLGVVRFRPALSVCRTMMSMIESSICGGSYERQATYGRQAWPPRFSQGKRSRDSSVAGAVGAGSRGDKDDAGIARESLDSIVDADAQPGQDRVQGGHLLAGRAGRAGARQQL